MMVFSPILCINFPGKRLAAKRAGMTAIFFTVILIFEMVFSAALQNPHPFRSDSIDQGHNGSWKDQVS
jgi:hypothetical protein